MFLFGFKRSSARSGFACAPASSAAPRVAASAAAGKVGDARRAPLSGSAFEAALLLAGLPGGPRADYSARLLMAAAKRPPWNPDDVGSTPAVQLESWHLLAPEKLRLHDARSLLLMLQTELEAGLRSMATPLWLLNRIVREVILLRQGRRIGQVYRELERQLGDQTQALAGVAQVFVAL